MSGRCVENHQWFSTPGVACVDSMPNEGIRDGSMAHSAATEARSKNGPCGDHQRQEALGTNGKKDNTVVATRAAAGLEEPIQARLESAFHDDDFEMLVRALVAVSRRRSTTEVESLKANIFHHLRERQEYAGDRRRVWLWTRMAAARPETEVREMACALLDGFWRDHRKEVERLTLNLARDEDREVRQYAAGTMARIVRSNFRQRFKYLQKWCASQDPLVRRQVVISVVGVVDPKHPERAKPLLDMIEPHMSDRDPYVRRNLGPFALGQGLLAAYPEQTLERFQDWLPSTDEIVRWNIATALAAAVALRQWKSALEVLRVLAADRRRFVWGAASAALGNLATYRSREVPPVLRRWMLDPTLRVAVSSALGKEAR